MATLTEILTLARMQLDDEQKPYKWTDAELVIYLNDVIKKACKDAQLLKDSTTTTTCRLTLATDTYDYALSALVLRVERAYVNGQSQPLNRRYKQYIDKATPNWRSDSSGLPVDYLLDYTYGYFTVRPAPSSTYNGTYVYLTVYRLPITDMSASLLTSSPEIRSEYHYKLIDGVLELAFMKPGQLTFNQFKSMWHGTRFNSSIEYMKRDMNRLYELDNQNVAAPDEGQT